MPTVSSPLDVLQDPNRRLVLAQLAKQPATPAGLAERLSAPPQILEAWLRALAAAGLLTTEEGGEGTRYLVDFRRVAEVRDFLNQVLGLPRAEVRGVPVSGSESSLEKACFLVRKEVDLRRSPTQAFRLFAQRMGDWWPLGKHHFGTAPAVTVVIEPVPGGRWYERGDDGSETLWGETLLWDPPRRLVLNWRVGPGWTYDPGVSSEVEVMFLPEGASSCRVRVEHRALALLGPKAAALQETLGGEEGWTDLLRRLAAVE